MAVYKAGQLITATPADCGIETKEINAGAEATAITTLPDGYISGTASAPSVDTMGHKVLPGAFDEAIRTKGFYGPNGIRLLAHHKWADIVGVIKEMKTVNNKLRLSGQLNKTPVAQNLYEIIKDTGGMSFSVGFRLQDFKFAEDEVTKQDILVVEKGDLMEVSIVTFPAHLDATMDFYKTQEEFLDSVKTAAEFEKWLVAKGVVPGRNKAHELFELMRNSPELFPHALAGRREPPTARPMLGAQFLKAASDQVMKARAVFGSAPQ